MWLSVPEKELNLPIGACRWVGACKTNPTDHRRRPSPEDGAGQVRATDLDQLFQQVLSGRVGGGAVNAFGVLDDAGQNASA